MLCHALCGPSLIAHMCSSWIVMLCPTYGTWQGSMLSVLPQHVKGASHTKMGITVLQTPLAHTHTQCAELHLPRLARPHQQVHISLSVTLLTVVHALLCACM